MVNWEGRREKDLMKLQFPSWRSGYRIRLGTMRLQVRSLALLGGLTIRRCRELCRLQTRLRSGIVRSGIVVALV